LSELDELSELDDLSELLLDLSVLLERSGLLELPERLPLLDPLLPLIPESGDSLGVFVLLDEELLSFLLRSFGIHPPAPSGLLEATTRAEQCLRCLIEKATSAPFFSLAHCNLITICNGTNRTLHNRENKKAPLLPFSTRNGT
jgi:hypothetical protein